MFNIRTEEEKKKMLFQTQTGYGVENGKFFQHMVRRKKTVGNVI